MVKNTLKKPVLNEKRDQNPRTNLKLIIFPLLIVSLFCIGYMHSHMHTHITPIDSDHRTSPASTDVAPLSHVTAQTEPSITTLQATTPVMTPGSVTTVAGSSTSSSTAALSASSSQSQIPNPDNKTSPQSTSSANTTLQNSTTTPSTSAGSLPVTVLEVPAVIKTVMTNATNLF